MTRILRKRVKIGRRRKLKGVELDIFFIYIRIGRERFGQKVERKQRIERTRGNVQSQKINFV